MVEQVGDQVERLVEVVDHQVRDAGAGAVNPRPTQQIRVEGGGSGDAGRRLGAVDEGGGARGHDDHVGQSQHEGGAAQAGTVDHQHHGHQSGRVRQRPGQCPPPVQ